MNINGGTYTMGGLGYHYGNSLPSDLRGVGDFSYGNALPSNLAGPYGYYYGPSLPTDLRGLGTFNFGQGLPSNLAGILEDDIALLDPHRQIDHNTLSAAEKPAFSVLLGYSTRLTASLRAARSGDSAGSLKYFNLAEAYRRTDLVNPSARITAEANRIRDTLVRLLPTIDQAAIAASVAEMTQKENKVRAMAAAGSTPEAIKKELDDQRATAIAVACPWAYGISYIPGMPVGALEFACLHGKKIALGAALVGAGLLYLKYRKR